MLTSLSKACWFHIPCRQNPTNTSRPLQSRPHPPATIPSNAFPLTPFYYLLFQSFPKHRNWQKLCFESLRPWWSDIGTPVDEYILVHILYWQKFLLILATTITSEPTMLTEVPSNPCDHNGPTSEPNKYQSTRTISSTSFRNLSKQCLSLWFPSIPIFPKAS